jgi:hypothetical protein
MARGEKVDMKQVTMELEELYAIVDADMDDDSAPPPPPVVKKTVPDGEAG